MHAQLFWVPEFRQETSCYCKVAGIPVSSPFIPEAEAPSPLPKTLRDSRPN